MIRMSNSVEGNSNPKEDQHDLHMPSLDYMKGYERISEGGMSSGADVRVEEENCSENSAGNSSGHLSISNNYFGFNFDSDEIMNNICDGARNSTQDNIADANLKKKMAADASAASATKQRTSSSSSHPKAPAAASQDSTKAIPPSLKRKERNAREKDRSLRISQEIDQLRALLSSGGVVAIKPTKSAVLTEAAKHIATLQSNLGNIEKEKQQLLRQAQMIASGALGPQAAAAIHQDQSRILHLPPYTKPLQEMPSQHPQYIRKISSSSSGPTQEKEKINSSRINDDDFPQIFESASVAMAIASMGGVFVECNKLFRRIFQCTKQDLCSMTIFNMLAKKDLQSAFDRISSMISPPQVHQENECSSLHYGQSKKSKSQPLLLGAMKNRLDIAVSVTLIWADNGVPRCFLVALLKEPTQVQPHYGGQHQPALFSSMDYMQHQPQSSTGAALEKARNQPTTYPTFTTG